MTNSDRELLEQIGKKIFNSSVLNGGFDKLVYTVDQVKIKQEEAVEKIEELSVALYQPKDGIYSKVQAIEHDLSVLKETKEKSKSLHKDVEDTKNITERLQRIGGKDLEDIEDIVALKKNATKIMWALISLVFLGVVNLLWTLSKKQN